MAASGWRRRYSVSAPGRLGPAYRSVSSPLGLFFFLLAGRPFLALGRRRRRRPLRLLRADGVLDLVHQAADAHGVGAEIERAVARGGARIDARAVGLGAHPDHDVVAKAHDRRARHRLDAALAASGLGARASTTRQRRL